MNKNGNGNNGTKRQQVFKARRRILRAAMRTGHITNARARRIGGFGQVWFHLNAMREAGILKNNGFNKWVPTKRAEQLFTEL
jgi:hypothetical protein